LILSERRLDLKVIADSLGLRLLVLLAGFEDVEGPYELLDVQPSLDSTELLLCLDNRGARPADDHRAALPGLHVPRLQDDPALQVLDRIRGQKLLV